MKKLILGLLLLSTTAFADVIIIHQPDGTVKQCYKMGNVIDCR